MAIKGGSNSWVVKPAAEPDFPALPKFLQRLTGPHAESQLSSGTPERAQRATAMGVATAR